VEGSGKAEISRSTGVPTILKSEERSTGPSLGTNSKTLPWRDRVVAVKWLVKLRQRSDPPRIDHVAEMAAFERVMLSPGPGGASGEALLREAWLSEAEGRSSNNRAK
jgi:hypothetical protein